MDAIRMMVLAQRVAPEAQWKAFFWLAVIMVVVILGGALILVLRNKLRADDTPGDTGGGFALSDLRAMRDRGEITEEEYQVARDKIAAKVKSNLERKRPKTQADEGGGATDGGKDPLGPPGV